MNQERERDLEAGEPSVELAPPVSAGAVLRLLISAEESVDDLLDKLYDTNEKNWADKLESAIQKTASFLGAVAGEMPTTEEGVKEHFQAEGAEEADQADEGLGDGEERRRMDSMEAKDMAGRLGMIQTIISEVAEELLSLSRDDLEEVSDATLAVTRLWVEFVGSWLRKLVQSFESQHTTEADHERQRRERGPQVEEATDDEIAEFYRARGEEPPPRPPPLSPKSRAASRAPPPPPHGGGRRRRLPERVLWQPIRPRLVAVVRGLPESFKEDPLRTAGRMALVLPFTGGIIFWTPGLLVTDHVLQKLYGAYGSGLEVVVDDGKQMARLGWTVTRLSVRQCARVIRRQAKKVVKDPAGAAVELAKGAIHVVTHPVETATKVGSVIYGGFCVVRGIYRAASDPVGFVSGKSE